MRKVKLADVLWDAANKHLWHGGPQSLDEKTLPAASCFAVDDALWFAPNYRGESDSFLAGLGLDTRRYQWSEFPIGPERQGVRYMWLLLAMHVAEDEDIEIEVAQ